MIRAFVFCFLLLTACNRSTEQKLTTAIKDIERQRFKNNDEKIESISIDSLSYDEANMQDFYRDQSERQVSVLEVQGERLQNVEPDDESQRAEQIAKRAARQLRIFKQLDALSKTADTTLNLYWVKYRLQAKTDKNRYDTTMEKYVSQNNLKEIKLNERFSSKEF